MTIQFSTILIHKSANFRDQIKIVSWKKHTKFKYNNNKLINYYVLTQPQEPITGPAH